MGDDDGHFENEHLIYPFANSWYEPAGASVELTSLDVVCISRQLAIISSEHEGVVLHRGLIALVKFHARRTAILVELANAVHLVAAAIANIFHDLR